MEFYTIPNNEELYHHGVKGMRWGVRKAVKKLSERRAYKKAKTKEYQENKAPKRYGMFDPANSAARTYYRQQRTNNFQTYKKQGYKLDLKQARLNDDQIKAGRYRVAKARNFKRKTLSGVVGTTAGAALIASGAGVVGVPVAAAVSVATNYISGGHYYSRQQRAYGNTRAKYTSDKKDW